MLYFDKSTQSFYTDLKAPKLEGHSGAEPVPGYLPVHAVPEDPLYARARADLHPDGNLDHRHDLPRRPAGPPALYGPADRGPLQAAAPARRRPRASSAQSEFFLYTKKDREAVEKCLELGLRVPEVTGWIRAVKSDFKLVKEMGLKETGILTSCSDYHIFLKLRKTAASRRMDMYLDIVKAGPGRGHHAAVPLRGHHAGRLLRLRRAVRRRADEAPRAVRDRPSRSALCDTMGYGVP